jgi:uncharacterized coiled-coil protein SlyX
LVDSSQQNENPDEEESAQSRVAELENLVTERDKEISLVNARITELEQTVANLEAEVAALNQSGLESERKLAEVGDALSQAIASYKARITESNPEIPTDLIAGDTIEAVDNSLESARFIIQKIREGLEADIKMIKVPAGAPPRAPIDLSALSPLEKIQYGIGGKR